MASPPESVQTAGPRMRQRSARSALIWVGALALALGLLARDSGQRAASIRSVTELRAGGAPAPGQDALSPTGYAGGTHRLVLPAIDGYHWVLQAERMLAEGGWRVREVEYDGGRGGREVHWAGAMRWWGAALARVDRAIHPGRSLPVSLETAAIWANPLLLGILLALVAPIVALRLGAVPAALFALGSVTVFPFYEYFVAGYFDHHGAAAMAGLVAVLLLAAGGAGWTREDAVARDPWAAWVPVPRDARRWFAASAVVAGAGLWINAAAIVPVLIGIGIAGLLDAVLSDAPNGSGVRPDPALWRLWGLVGAATSLICYAVEYAPAHLGWRLEVNHPLYALAWAGAGDLLCRVGYVRRDDADIGVASRWIAVDAAAVLVLPAVVLATGERTFRLADGFLLDLHRRYIAEFLTLPSQLAVMTPADIAGRISPAPLILVVVAAVAWTAAPTGWRRWVWRGAWGLAALVAAAYAALVLGALLPALLALAATVALVGALLLPATHGGAPVVGPGLSLLLLASAPAVVALTMALVQVRWVGTACALSVGTMAVIAFVLRDGGPERVRQRARVGAAALVVVASLVVAPVLSLRLALPTTDAPQLVVRDASYWLRRRLGPDDGVVFASPNATTQMVWFGGFRGLGTLYWENLAGLRASTAVWTAPTAADARALLADEGVTHLALFPFDPGLDALAAAHAGMPGTALAPAGFLGSVQASLLADSRPALPLWLRPLPYPAPVAESLGRPAAILLEVVPDQRPEIALLRLAQYHEAQGNPAAAERALRESLAARPSAAAWAALAMLHAVREDVPGFGAALGPLRAALSADPEAMDAGDRVVAGVVLAIARDPAGAAAQLDLALREMDERGMRALSVEALNRLVGLARQMELEPAHADALALADSLLLRGAAASR